MPDDDNRNRTSSVYDAIGQCVLCLSGIPTCAMRAKGCCCCLFLLFFATAFIVVVMLIRKCLDQDAHLCVSVLVETFTSPNGTNL